MRVRPSCPGDAEAILAVVAGAFSDDRRDASEELAIVRDTWELRRAPDLLELVAEDGRGIVVGHVLAATGDLGGHPVPGVAPLGVLPGFQRSGIGSALMDAVIAGGAERSWPLLLLLGEPGYYSRFGFEPSGPLGIAYPPVGRDNPHFMARRLPGYSRDRRGEFRYCWE